MADEVFALSPISASPALPGEADYDAIRDAFMETSRGRWFLGEYAKRNRNSDTGMVLDAVARIEQALAAQRHSQQSDDNALPEALAKIRAALDDATRTANGALEDLRIGPKLTPVRIGTRIIKEISWRWREIGTDSRICDLIDSQVAAIDAACEQLTDIDPQAALTAAFEIIKTQLDTLDGAGPAASADDAVATNAKPAEPPADSAARSPETVAASNSPPSRADLPDAESVKAQPEQPRAEAVAPIAAPEPVATSTPTLNTPSPTEAFAEPDAAESTGDIVPDFAALEAEIGAATAEVQHTEDVLEAQQEAQLAQDEADDDAVLELVAMEMASDDPIDDEEFGPVPTAASAAVEQIALDDDIIALTPSFEAPEPEISAPSITPTQPAAPQPSMTAPIAPPAAPVQEAPAAAPALQIVSKNPAHEGSLGSSLLANGLVQRPRVAASDPLTPIRRMSQPEKIAFFS